MASTTADKALQPDLDSIQRMRFRKAMARKKRVEREAENEISELNLTAMMDMMTIILVFLLKSFSASTVSMTTSEDIRPPVSSTRAVPKDTVAVTITNKTILVGDKKVVDLAQGRVPEGALSGRLVVPLHERLQKEVEKLKTIESRGGAPFSREMSVIADRKIPYDLLLTVLYTAGQNELENYRFVVIQKEGGE
ncbi:MAG: ExbD/TolR family protein [Myxococcota bacterium]